MTKRAREIVEPPPEPKRKRGGIQPSRKSKKPGQDQAIALRRTTVMDMLLKGNTQSEIARHFDLSPTVISLDVRAVMHELARARLTDALEYRDVELARLDAMWATYVQPALDGDIDAAKFCLSVSAARSRILGIDAPQRLEVTGKGGGPLFTVAAIQALVEQYDHDNPPATDVSST